MSQVNRIKELLRKRKGKGISPLDFPTGYRLSHCILVLRKRGYDINTDRTQFLPCTMATYTLIREPESV